MAVEAFKDQSCKECGLKHSQEPSVAFRYGSFYCNSCARDLHKTCTQACQGFNTPPVGCCRRHNLTG